jgi:hypothetical protein
MRTGRIFERAAQKSDTCAVGIATSAPKKCGFSAQTAGVVRRLQQSHAQR